VLEAGAGGGQGINVRGAGLAIAIAAEVIGAQRVNGDEQEVGTRGSGGTRVPRRAREQRVPQKNDEQKQEAKRQSYDPVGDGCVGSIPNAIGPPKLPAAYFPGAVTVKGTPSVPR
jgi:hypothetical protein